MRKKKKGMRDWYETGSVDLKTGGGQGLSFCKFLNSSKKQLFPLPVGVRVVCWWSQNKFHFKSLLDPSLPISAPGMTWKMRSRNVWVLFSFNLQQSLSEPKPHLTLPSLVGPTFFRQIKNHSLLLSLFKRAATREEISSISRRRGEEELKTLEIQTLQINWRETRKSRKLSQKGSLGVPRCASLLKAADSHRIKTNAAKQSGRAGRRANPFRTVA